MRKMDVTNSLKIFASAFRGDGYTDERIKLFKDELVKQERLSEKQIRALLCEMLMRYRYDNPPMIEEFRKVIKKFRPRLDEIAREERIIKQQEDLEKIDLKFVTPENFKKKDPLFNEVANG